MSIYAHYAKLLCEHNLFHVVTCGTQNEQEEQASDLLWQRAVELAAIDEKIEHAESLKDLALAQFRRDFARYQQAFNLLWCNAEYHGFTFEYPCYTGMTLAAALSEFATHQGSRTLRALNAIADDRRTLYHISRDTLHALRAS